MTYEQRVNDFLAQKVIAIAGVSRNPKGDVGNPIYKKFKVRRLYSLSNQSVCRSN